MNPFTPDFGRRPPLLVGQDAILGDVRVALSAGPRVPEYTRLLLGHRGSGKTTLLAEVADIARMGGLMVVQADAASPGLNDRIITAVSEELIGYETIADVLESRAQQQARTRVTGVGIGPISASWDSPATERAGLDLRYTLLRLAEAALEAGSGVALIVDELHAGDRDELRRLAADVQYITKTKELPLSFTGAGLLEMEFTVLTDKKMTFFHRCARHRIEGVDRGDAWACLRRTIVESGLEVDEEALRVMADSVTGKTFYHLQSVGYRAWRIGTAGGGKIDATTAREAVREADADSHHKIAVPLFHDLAPSDQILLETLASMGGRAGNRELSQRLDELGVQGDARRRASYRLGILGLVRVGGGHVWQEGMLTPEDVVSATAGLGGPAPNGWTGRPSSPTAICGHVMPRAKAKCILPPGHGGKHRSKR